MRVLGNDIGIKHLAHYLINIRQPEIGRQCQALDWASLQSLLPELGFKAWQVVSLCDPSVRNVRSLSDSALVTGVVAYFNANQDLFKSADTIVVEQQPAARMRVVASALLALAKTQKGQQLLHNIVLQHASRKLDWGCGGAFAACKKSLSYSQRKRVAVQICQKMLDFHPSVQEAFCASFLHALRYALCPGKKKSPLQRKRMREITNEITNTFRSQHKVNVVGKVPLRSVSMRRGRSGCSHNFTRRTLFFRTLQKFCSGTLSCHEGWDLSTFFRRVCVFK